MTKHTRLCSTKGCPAPYDPEYSDWHIRQCLHIEGVEHAEGGHHHHWPKRSQGGTEIVGFPCAFCHDRIDNQDWGNKVEQFPDGTRRWLVWDLHGETLIERVIGRWKEDGEPVEPRETLPAEPATSAPRIDETRPALPEVEYGATSLVLPDSLTYERWVSVGATLGQMGKGLPWYLGDWLNHGERAYGEKYAQAIDELGLKYQRAANLAWVASKVEVSTRVESLSWAHHREVAGLGPDEQRIWLARAQEEKLSSRQLHDAINDEAPECPESETGRHDVLHTCRVCKKEW